MMVLRVLLIYSMMFLAPISLHAQVTANNQTYNPNQNQVDQESQGFTDQTTQAVGDSQRTNQIQTGTQGKNIQSGGSGLGKSLLLAGAGSLAAALVLTKIAAAKAAQGTKEFVIGDELGASVVTMPSAPPWYAKSATSYAIAGGMTVLALLAARQSRSNYQLADQAFDTAAASSWCGRAECPTYNPGNIDPGAYTPGGGGEGGSGGGPGNSEGNNLYTGGGSGTMSGVDDGSGGSADNYLTPEQQQARANLRSMIAREKGKANALISELEKKGYKLSDDGKTLMTPKGPINPESMGSAEGMKSAGFSEDAIKGIEDNLKAAATEAAKIAAAKEGEIDGMIGEGGGSRNANSDPTMPGFDPSKYLKGLNLNGTPGNDRVPAGLAIQLSSGESIGARNDNIFAMVQRAYKIQQRTGQLGQTRQPAQQRAAPGPAAPMGF